MKRILSFILVLVMVCTMLPHVISNVSAKSWIKVGTDAKGSDYSVEYAAKLDNIFQGKVSLFSNTSDKFPLGSNLNNSREYMIANNYYSGYQCYIYAQAVYYYLFGDVVYHGNGSNYWSDSQKVLSNQTAASFDLFSKAGVGFGAYLRTTTNTDGSYSNSGHSIIVLSYNKTGITFLEGNAHDYGNGYICITIRTWDEFNSDLLSTKGRRIGYVVQCKSAQKKHSFDTVGICSEGECACGYAFDWEATFKDDCAGTYKVTRSAGVQPRTEKPYDASTAKGDLIPYGTTVNVLGSVTNHYQTNGVYNKWYKISYNGVIGYVYHEHLTEVAHTCNKGNYMYFEAEHPHRDCYKCSICGKIWAVDGTSNVYGSCEQCQKPGKPTLVIKNGKTFEEGEQITFTWASTSNTTHYNLWIEYRGRSGKWERYDHLTYVKSGKTESFPAGEYRCCVQAYNSNAWASDGSDWLYTESDYVSFSVISCDHSYTCVTTKAATCLEDGISTYTCRKCGESYTEPILATGYHSWGAWGVTESATCTTSGTRSRKCYVCGGEESETIPATGQHNYVSRITSAATCDSDGVKTYTCSGCSNTYTETIPAPGHDFQGGVCSVCAIGQNPCGNGVYWHLDESGNFIVFGNGRMADYSNSITPWENVKDQISSVTIRSGVKNVGAAAFTHCNNLSYVSLEEGVFDIDAMAFYECSSLMSVSIPKSLIGIRHNAFAGCISLSWIDLSPVSFVGEWAFAACLQLSAVTFTGNLQEIGDRAFSGCDGIKEITFTGHKPAFGEDCFSDTRIMAFYPSTDASWTSISQYDIGNIRWIPVSYSQVCDFGVCGEDVYFLLGHDFTLTVSGCGEMYDYSYGEAPWYERRLDNPCDIIVIEEGITHIGSYAFFECYSEKISLPNGLLTIGDSAFEHTNIREIRIPETVTTLGNYVFWNCRALTNIIIPDSVTNMGSLVFNWCESLGYVVVGTGIQRINYRVFNNCTGLKSVVFRGDMPYIDSEAFLGTIATCYYLPENTSWEDLQLNGYGGVLEWKELNENETLRIGGGEFQDGLMWSLDINGQLVISGCGHMDTQGDPVAPWIWWKDSSYPIQKAVIEDGVENIAGWALGGLSTLTSLEVHNSVDVIESYAFVNCSALSMVYLPNSLETIGSSAFKNCSNIKTVVYCGTQEEWNQINIGENNTALISANRSYHSYITEVRNPSCGKDGAKIFTCQYCGDRYTESIPATGDHNWGDWIVIEQATCGNAGWWERQCCDCAEEDIFIPGYASHNLVTISGYPATCTEDGLSDGSQCSNCGEVAVAQEVIPATGHAWGQWTQTQAPSCAVEGINMRTCNCGASETEVIPMLVHSYEDGFCTTCGAYEFEIVASGKCGDNVHWVLYVTGTLVIYGTGAMTNYSPYSSAPWCSNGGDVKIAIIENGVTSIGQCAFRYCVGLTSVAIGNGVTSIGDEAFDNCTSLTSIVIPDSVTRIGDSAFDGCTGLTSVTIPDSVTRIGSHAFIRCKRLTSITIGSGVTSIGPAAFSSCGKLNSVCFNASNCTVMGSSTGQVFSSCTSLTTVNIGKNVLTIPAYAFDGCSSLTSVAIPDSVTSIGDAAFRSCSGLTSITIPDSVISIGGSAFKGCTGLTSMTIPGSVTSIGGAAFQNCYNLTRVAIPDSITSIGCGTFQGCQNLIRVTIPDSVTSIGDEAFDYCTSLAAVVIPSSVTSIGDDAFDYCINLAYVIYCGTEEQWNNISIGSGKTQLTSVREYHNWNGAACGNNRVCNYCSTLESYSWTLCADTIVDICLTEDLYIDLNGFDLTGTINTNGFKVYGMDSSTNEYTCDNMGHFSCVDENGNAIVPESLYTTDDMMRYMTIETDNGYTFHRYYLGITNISLAPSVTGFGYKAEFHGDEMVQSQIAAIGYNLWITEDRVISRTSDFKNTLTLRLKNFDAANYGETPVNACVSITLVDGTVITGDTHSNTMRQVVETVNRNHASYSETQIQAVQEMIEANTVMKSWDVDSLLEDEWFTDDEFWD